MQNSSDQLKFYDLKIQLKDLKEDVKELKKILKNDQGNRDRIQSQIEKLEATIAVMSKKLNS